MNLAEVFLQRAQASPRDPALFTGTCLDASFAELEDRVRRLAARLYQFPNWGECPHLAILMENRSAFWEAVLACWMAGGTIVPLNAKLHQHEISQLLASSGASVIVTSSRFADTAVQASGACQIAPAIIDVDAKSYVKWRDSADPLSAPCTSMRPAWFFFTSGTTGRAKGAVLSHANLLAMCAAYHVDLARVASGDRFIHLAPLSHGSGLYGLPFLLAGAANIHPGSGGFSVDEAEQLFRAFPQASSFLAPTMVRRLVSSCGASLHGCLRTLVYGGGPMHLRDIEQALDALGPCLAQIYGQGETPMTITALSREDHIVGPNGEPPKLASVGKPRFATKVAIANPDGSPLPVGQVGEIMVKGPTVMSGYLNSVGATDATLRNGWLLTGDIGSLDSFGYLTLLDRSKEVIITGGSNVYPREVEEIVLRHPAVSEAAVFGMPHDEWGEEIVCAYAVTNGGSIDEAELDALCLSAIARFKRPKRYMLVEELPKTGNGKIDKAKLRANASN